MHDGKAKLQNRGSIVDRGAITVDHGGKLAVGDLTLGAALSRGGEIVMDQSAQIIAGVSGAVSTNVDDPIEAIGGTALGQFGGNGAGQINVTFVNESQGVVEAVGQGGNTGALIISGGFTNDGTLTAISGGALYFNSNATIQNNGVISANGAAVAFEGQIGSRRWFYGKRVGGRGNLQPSPRTSRSAFDRRNDRDSRPLVIAIIMSCSPETQRKEGHGMKAAP